MSTGSNRFRTGGLYDSWNRIMAAIPEFEAKTAIVDALDDIEEAAERAAFETFREAAFAIRKDAADSIERDSTRSRDAKGRFRKAKRSEGTPSQPGTPPHTRRANVLKRGIQYDADKYGAIIGPAYSIAGTVGMAHEFGGRYKGADFPERSFMEPALERQLDRFAGSWRSRIGG